MGRDKALIEVDGVPLWQRQLRILQELGPTEIFLAGPSRPDWQDAGCTIIPDAQEDSGPLGGLVTALRHCSTSLLLALAVDLPRLTSDYLRELLDLCGEKGVVPVTDRLQPLVAIYPVNALPLAEQLLSNGRYSLQNFAACCMAEGLTRQHPVGPEERSLFLNMNTPADLVAFQTSVGDPDARDSVDSTSTQTVLTHYRRGATPESRPDYLAAESPLEIRIEGHSVAVVMRTPGHDRELAAGFLLTENLVRRPNEIFEITQCGGQEENVINITLRDPTSFDPARLTRHLFTSSSCGVCSKATIDAVRQSFPPVADDCAVAAETLLELPARLREKQATFAQTGGLHACALFDLKGEMQNVREDVGRHNALDKLIGRALMDDRLPLRDHVLLLSGRVSFEMMQKALAAGIPIVAAISAPTSLAVEFARESNQTLVGFIRGQTLNVYAGEQRIR